MIINEIQDFDMAIELSFYKAFSERDDLKCFGSNALSLFALQLQFPIDDISSIAATSITEGADDKKADIIYIDEEL